MKGSTSRVGAARGPRNLGSPELSVPSPRRGRPACGCAAGQEAAEGRGAVAIVCAAIVMLCAVVFALVPLWIVRSEMVRHLRDTAILAVEGEHVVAEVAPSE